jgi:hypothetical protein
MRFLWLYSTTFRRLRWIGVNGVFGVDFHSISWTGGGAHGGVVQEVDQTARLGGGVVVTRGSLATTSQQVQVATQLPHWEPGNQFSNSNLWTKQRL